jgi:methyltransferase family protein
LLERLAWRDDRMLLDDLVFRLALADTHDWELGEDCFHFYKTKSLIDQYAKYWLSNDGFVANRIVELGIWDGGSVAFWFEYFHPDKHVAIDILERKDTPYFQRYKASRGLESAIQTFWGTDQADSEALRRIIHSEFSGELDLVIDDASHIYKATKVSFETLFPFLRPGGLYIIEDWGWEYWESCYAPSYPLATERGLAKFLFELVGATASSSELISSMNIFQGFVVIERGGLHLSARSEFQTETFISRRPPLSRLRARAARTLSRESRRTRSILMRMSSGPRRAT